jgi:hypothetical protein
MAFAKRVPNQRSIVVRVYGQYPLHIVKSITSIAFREESCESLNCDSIIEPLPAVQAAVSGS